MPFLRNKLTIILWELFRMTLLIKMTHIYDLILKIRAQDKVNVGDILTFFGCKMDVSSESVEVNKPFKNLQSYINI